MVHGLTSQLGGVLTIQSQLGQGTMVELWLPISLDPGETAVVGRPPHLAPHARGRALLVDDEDIVRMSASDMLADLGHDVVEAGSADDALQSIQEGMSVDLLVTG